MAQREVERRDRGWMRALAWLVFGIATLGASDVARAQPAIVHDNVDRHESLAQAASIVERTRTNLEVTRRTPLLNTSDGWRAYVDGEVDDFRFDGRGNVVSWFDPVSVYAPAPLVR